MTKILFLTNHLNPGGITTYIRLLTNGLDKSKYEVVIVSGGGLELESFRRNGIRCHAIPMHTSSEVNPKLIGAAYKLRQIINNESVDIIHCQTRVAQVVSMLAGHRSLPRVFTCHGYFKQRLVRRLIPLWGEAIISISKHVSKHLTENWNVNASRIRLIYHGVLAKDESAAPKSCQRSEFGIGPKDIVIGLTGRFSKVKGYDLALRAFCALEQKDRPLKLMLCGRGEEEQALRQMIPEDKQNDILLVTSPLGMEHAKQTFDFVCAPSRREGLGLSILESMRDGLPVVGSNVGGIPEIIIHNKNGLLFNIDRVESLVEAMQFYCDHDVERIQHGRAAQERIATHFSPKTMASKTAELYDQVKKG
ncbi:MAG: glycosyltransferase involved in cell wall biosynthesis [Candidatus Omnitrophota bacterium]|jgi:glycosyltransferase involved in cell wall biosynthesis